jgi:hypothetical protein
LKGYVNVHVDQINEAIAGFNKQRDDGKVIRDKGIELYYQKYFTDGSWLTKWLNRNRTPIQFARKNVPAFGSWDDLFHSLLTTEENDLLGWWAWNNSDHKIQPLKSLVSQSATGFVLVDNEMATMIESYRSYK